MMLRWQRLERDLTAGDGPTVEVVDLRRTARPAVPPSPRRSASARGCTPRPDRGRQAAASREGCSRERGTRALLEGKVVVLSGVGPGLGVAGRGGGARMGADLVLASAPNAAREDAAARSAETAGRASSDRHHRRGPPANLLDRTLEEYGRVDCLINNAFAIPPMDPVTTLDDDASATAYETNVFAPLRLRRAVRRRPGEPRGSIVMVNSCGVCRHRSRSTAATRCPRARWCTWHRRWRPSSGRAASGQHRGAVVDLRGRQQGLLRLARRGARRDPRGGLPRDRRPDGPEAARHARGGRPRDAVPRLGPRLRGHRRHHCLDVELRRVPRLHRDAGTSCRSGPLPGEDSGSSRTSPRPPYAPPGWTTSAAPSTRRGCGSSSRTWRRPAG